MNNDDIIKLEDNLDTLNNLINSFRDGVNKLKDKDRNRFEYYMKNIDKLKNKFEVLRSTY